jgi:hypothetical protein
MACCAFDRDHGAAVRQAVPVTVHPTQAAHQRRPGEFSICRSSPHSLAMERIEAPRADLPLLLYLACVTALLGLFASAFYGLMQPTVIPNAGMAGYKAPGPANMFLHKPDSSAEAMERAAIDAARAENEDQGIEPLRAFASAEPAPANSSGLNTNGAALPHAKQAKAKPKPKRVAKQETVADPWRSSWNSPWHSWEHERRRNSRPGPTGGRHPLWAFRDGFQYSHQR